jgi:hypothetical protein
VERANLARHARRQYGLCLGLSAIRSGNRRGLAGADRAPDRTDPGADETVSGDGGHIAAERDEVQHLLHVGQAFATVNAIYARYFPVDPPARIFVCVPEWTGPFDIEIDCMAVV